MILSIKELTSYTIEAKDGSVGQVESFLFDDQRWVLRYLVVDTKIWLPGRKVLIPTSNLEKPDAPTKAFPVDLTKEQVKNSPDIDTAKPVHRQHEIELYQHYNWFPYWNAPLEPMVTPYGFTDPELTTKTEETDKDSDPHLRNFEEVKGYKIHAKDGHIGHIDDLLVDTEDWKIRYIVIDTKNWMPGKKVILPPYWIKEINWSESKVVVDVSKDTVENSPEFDSRKPITRDYETILHEHYGWPVYWL